MIQGHRPLALLVGALLAAEAHAAGPDSDLTARAVGRAGAVAAGGSAPIAYNPAALVDGEAEASVTYVSRGATFADLHDRAEADVLPFAAITRRFGPLVLGAGAYRAIGASWSWPNCMPTPCVPGNTAIERDVFPLGLAWRTRWLAVGATARLEAVQVDVPGQKVEHLAPSGNMGLIVGGPVRLGVAIELPADAGDASQPWKLRGGARLVRGRLDAEVGGTWEGWSSLRLPVALRDTGSLRAGFDVGLSWLTVRAGWAWERAAVDPDALVMALPDLDRHRLAAGASACASGLCVDLAYAHAFELTARGYAGRMDTVALSIRLDWRELRQAD